MVEWTYLGYWHTVLGLGSAAEIVRDFELAPGDERGLDEWLGLAEAEAWRVGGGEASALPESWRGYHARALRALGAVEVQS